MKKLFTRLIGFVLLLATLFPSVASAALLPNLVSYWKLDESSGNAADSVGSNTGVNTAVTYSAGKINNGAVYNGTTAKLTAADNATLDITSNLTISLWVNLKSQTTDGQVAFGKGPLSSGTSFAYSVQIGANADGTVRGLVGNGATFNSTGDSASIKDNNWHHVVVVFIPSTSLTLYIDGAQVAQNTTSIVSSIQNTATDLLIGSDTDGRTMKNTSIVDEVGLWSTNLSAADVTQLYNSGNGLQYPFSSSATRTIVNNAKVYILNSKVIIK